MDNMKNLKKVWMNSLSCLDNCYVNAAIVVILLIYSSELFGNVNSFVGNLYHSAIIRFIVLLLIIFIAAKDTTIAILLTISYIVSLHYKMSNENFVSSSSKKMNIHDILGEEHSLHAMQHPMIKNKIQAQMNNNKMQPPMNNNNMQPQMNNTQHSNNNMQPMKQKIENFSSKNASNKKKEHFFPLNPNGSTPDDYKINNVNENFFPMMNMNEDSNFNVNTQSTENQMSNQVPNSNLSKNECLNNYTPRFEAIGDICSPTATFQNELNAQGLNFPEGFDSAGMGSPLNSNN